MIFDCVLASSCDDGDISDPCADSLFNDILDKRFVDKRQHFLRLRLCGWQKSCSQSCGRKYCLRDTHIYSTIVPIRNQRVRSKKCMATVAYPSSHSRNVFSPGTYGSLSYDQ